MDEGGVVEVEDWGDDDTCIHVTVDGENVCSITLDAFVRGYLVGQLAMLS